MIVIAKKIDIVNALITNQKLPNLEPGWMVLDLMEYVGDLRFELIKLSEKCKEIFILSPKFITIPDKISNANITLILKNPAHTPPN